MEVEDVHGLPQRLHDHRVVPAGQPGWAAARRGDGELLALRAAAALRLQLLVELGHLSPELRLALLQRPYLLHDLFLVHRRRTTRSIGQVTHCWNKWQTNIVAWHPSAARKPKEQRSRKQNRHGAYGE